MKKILFKPIALAVLLSAGMYGCASSSDSITDATAVDETTISETQTMAGSTSDAEESTSTNEAEMADVDYSGMFSTVENTDQYDLVSLAKMDPNLTTFVTLVEQAGIGGELMKAETYTVFAPTNAAFAMLPQEKLDMLMRPENKAELIKILQAHVIPTEVSSSSFNSSQRIETGGGEYIMVDVGNNNSYVSVGGATIVKPDVEASNGVIHVVDKVIQPTENINRY